MFLTSHVLCRLSSPLLLLPPTLSPSPSPTPHLSEFRWKSQPPPRHNFIFIIKSSSIFPSQISVLAHQIVHHTPKVIIHCLLFCSNIIFLSLWTHIENDIPNIIIIIIICTYKMILVHIYFLSFCRSLRARVFFFVFVFYVIICSFWRYEQKNWIIHIYFRCHLSSVPISNVNRLWHIVRIVQ